MPKSDYITGVTSALLYFKVTGKSDADHFGDFGPFLWTPEGNSTSLRNTQSVSNFFSNRFTTSYEILSTSPYILLKNQNLNRSHRDCTNCNMVKGISFVSARTK